MRHAMGQMATGDATRKALAEAMRDLSEAEQHLSVIERSVFLRQEEHRITSDWMGLMARQARLALSRGTLGQLMTREWLDQLSRVGQRHDTASERLQEAIEAQRKALEAHQTIAARVRRLRQEASRLPAPTGMVPSRIVVPTPIVVPTSYYPWGLTSSIMSWR